MGWLLDVPPSTGLSTVQYKTVVVVVRAQAAEGKRRRKAKHRRRKLRKVLDDEALAAETVAAQRAEEERMQRLLARRQLLAQQQQAQQVQPASAAAAKAKEVIELSSDDDDIVICAAKPGRAPALRPGGTLIEIVCAAGWLIVSCCSQCVTPSPPCPAPPRPAQLESSDEEDEDARKLKVLKGINTHLDDTQNVPDAQGRVLVNVDHDPGEPDIFLLPELAAHIKAHQIGGVRMMYDVIVESLAQYGKDDGYGCVLSHVMGAGKTFQMVCFIWVLLKHTAARKVLAIVPINVVQNWLAEFNMWYGTSPGRGTRVVAAVQCSAVQCLDCGSVGAGCLRRSGRGCMWSTTRSRARGRGRRWWGRGTRRAGS
jgi:RAD54-like protein 2